MNRRPAQATSLRGISGAAGPDGTAAHPVSQLLDHLGEVSRTRSDDCVRLLDDVEDIRRGRQRECVRLLQELTPHLRAARTVERELDRHLARRFNVFRYLRDDELGLSRIIAELLDPAAEHGQGAIFLEAMLELLRVPLGPTATDKIRIVQERGIPGRRRIDVTVDIPTDDGTFCLAFENKPYADDQPGQCRDYLEFLGDQYGERFLLVYLPPRCRMPDERSLPAAVHRRWNKQFRVLPYVADDAPLGGDDPPDGDGVAPVRVDSGEDDAFAGDDAVDHGDRTALDDAAVGDDASLADWFGTCCKLSDADRLRWFLREAQLYCQQHFGRSTMTDTEARYIREYLEENPRHLPAAFAVARAWRSVKHDVCRRFLEHLRDKVKEQVRHEMPEIAHELNVGFVYDKDKGHSSYLRVYRYGWVQCENGSPKSDGRTAVMLECGSGGPTSWHWGVRSPRRKDKMTEPEKVRRAEVESFLMRRGLSLPNASWWPHIERPRYQNWSDIVPELAKELADGGGKITDHYVNGLLKIAEKAIPAIDEVELENLSASDSGDS